MKSLIHFFLFLTHTKRMNYLSIGITILLLLLFLPNFFTLKLTYDLLVNKGRIQVFLFHKIKLINLKFSIYKKQLRLVKKNKKVLYVTLIPDEENLVFLNTLQQSLLKRIIFKRIGIEFFIGILNPFYTAIFSGFLKTGTAILTSYVRSKNKNIKPVLNVNANYKKEEIKIEVFMQLYLSNISFLLSLFHAFYKIGFKKKELIYGRKAT